MQARYLDSSLDKSRTTGIWPVTSLSTNYYRAYLPTVFTALTDRPDASSPVHILDIGASFGDSLAHFAQTIQEEVGETTATVALDVNRQTLLGAQRRRNADSVVWGWAQDLPFGAETFDIVLAKKLIAFLPPDQQSLILREIDRVLAPTGVVGVELDLHGTDALDTSSHCVLSGEAIGILRQATDGFERYPLPIEDISGCVRLSAD